MKVSKAVIPAAGFGTRFLPATKAVPKEMLPVVDRPMIEYTVAEAVQAGIRDVVIVVSEGKDAIRKHFSPAPELEAALEAAGKLELLTEVRERSGMASIEYVIQEEQLGLGHAVSVARDAIGDEAFAVLLPDEVMAPNFFRSLIDVFDERGSSVLALLEMPIEEVSAYGCPEVKPVSADLVEILSIVEKPAVEEAPSNLGSIGRYVFTPQLWGALEQIEPGVGGELQLTDAIALLIEDQPVYGAILRDWRHDVGKKTEFLEASIELALDRDDLGPDLARFLVELVRRRGLT